MATNTSTSAAKKGTRIGRRLEARRASRNPRTADASRRRMLMELAESFDATRWGVVRGEVLGADDVFQLLDITPEQVVLLCATGHLKGVALSSEEVGVPFAEVIRFLEEHGDWWFALRGRKQLERLREMGGPKSQKAT